MINYFSERTNISGNECNHKLFRLGALRPRLWYNILVQCLQCPLKASELHHRVRDLTTPQRYNTLVEPNSHIVQRSTKYRTRNIVGLSGITKHQ